ncbi:MULTISPECIES: MMPL/RND family transporter [Mycobacterium avium complex (MAC)]|uniref:Membrane protein, MmpL family n=1 Tax=Mycobacterium paraintracellulare TaxID=1138383 RepID=A0ABM7KBC5_9MYCO|nr:MULTISPECIES: MMPL family transporter [Mycobacterium avium complex (MAC)]MEE3754909.1 MMPL family transporter [Mycobacterium intracellulare]OSC27789.1 MMPL family RND transporter [Mycobacterium paraintracellulare]BBY71407.1 putative membrane protein, MmpL family [Mycobacterium paraintracellulare]
MSNETAQPSRSRIARLIRVLAVPIILFWLLVALGTTLFTPSLGEVAGKHSVPMTPVQAPAFKDMMTIGHKFKEFDTDSTAMVVLEGDDKLADSAHVFYNKIVAKLKADKHVQNVQDFWSDPLTAAGSQSPDGKAAYVQVFLDGAQGTTPSHNSVAAVRKIVKSVPPPPGVKAYVAGNTVLNTDTLIAAHNSMDLMTTVTIAVIFVMLLFIYRSLKNALLALVLVRFELYAAEGVVATAGNLDIIGLTPYAVSMVTMLTIATGTDYFIFLLGRYHEARSRGEDREQAYYTAYHGVLHVILGSGLTIVGACLCLTATRLPYFQTMGVPCAIALVVTMLAGLTLAPALLAVASRFGFFDPKREVSERGWRRVGTFVTRWPKPIIVVTFFIAVIGFVSLTTYIPSYNDRKYTPPTIAANVAQAAAERHFSPARMNPELLMVDAGHDVRNPSDMLVIDRIAKAVFHERGIGRVQTITRPLGAPIEHSSIPFQIAMQNSATLQTAKFNNDNTAQMLQQADELSHTIAIMEHMYGVMKDLTATTHSMVGKTHEMVDTTNELRDHISDFDDFFRPIRSYFYWEKHCFDIPVCWSLRSLFDTLDGIDELADQISGLTGDLDRIDQLMPKLLADFPATIDSMKTMRDFLVSTHSTMAGIQAHMQEGAEGSTLMGQYFDEAKNDDSFYLPPEVFKNPDFKRGLKMFVSPDGTAVRFIITHQGDPASVEGIRHVQGIKQAVADAIKGTPMESAKVYLAGTASMYSDMQDGVIIDLTIAGIATLILIFSIMLLITRSLVAALVIVGTVLASLGTACGLSVLLWQDILGLGLQWIVLPLTVIILLAVGSDYNLLLVSRLKEEIPAGLKTGIIRGMGASGRVVTAAGLIFAATMASMIVSDLRVIGQFGTAIGMGLLVDTFIVRAFMTPAIAAVLGHWFWWPLNTFRTKKIDGPEEDARTAPIPQLSSR